MAPVALAQETARGEAFSQSQTLLALGDSSGGSSGSWLCRVFGIGCGGTGASDEGYGVGDAVEFAGGVAQGEFEKQTGLDAVRDVVEIDAGKIADKTVEYIRGDVPSPLMESLLAQIATDNKFELWTKKSTKRNVPYFANACQRAANQRAIEGMRNAITKARLAPWVDISWEAVKAISSGGKSVADLVKENTKAKAEELIKEALFGKADPVVETVTIPHYDACDTKTTVTWDPINMRIIISSKGNCGCAFFSAGTGNANEGARLSGFDVVIVAPVTVANVRIQEKNRFIFWRSYSVQAQYKVGKLNVATVADCGCSNITDPPPPPPPPKKEKGWIAGVVDWFIDLFDGSDDETIDDTGSSDGEGAGEDVDTDKAQDDDEKTTDTETKKDAEDDDSRDTEKTDDAKDKTKDERGDDTDSDDDENTKQKARQCGDRIAIDGRENVPTYPSRIGENNDANFTCNNSCAQNEVCRVIPPEEDMLSCVYCARVCGQGEYIDLDSCERALTNDVQYCESTGVPTWGNETCYAIKERQSNACESAVRFIFTDYFAWIDPPVAFTGTGATFSNDQRCVSEAEYDETVRYTLDEALSDPQLRSMCPTLELVSADLIRVSGGAKGLCRDEIKFKF